MRLQLILLAGPWEIVIDSKTHKLYALTMIDTVTNLVELSHVASTKASDAATQLEITWLMRYPRPVYIIHDQGTEFTGKNFQWLIRVYGIQNVPMVLKTRKPMRSANECIKLLVISCTLCYILTIHRM